MRSITFLFNKNSFRPLNDKTWHETKHSFRVSIERFNFRILHYTLYYTQLHTSMMLMQCFSKKLYSVTPRVLQGVAGPGRERGRAVLARRLLGAGGHGAACAGAGRSSQADAVVHTSMAWIEARWCHGG